MSGRPKLWLSPSRVLEIRRAALRILRKVNYVDGAVDLDKVATALNASIRYAPYEGDLAGMLIRKDDKNIIAVNSAHHRNRQRFTIAHECGHLIFHHDNLYVDRDFSILRRDKKSSEASDTKEIEANQFAAELLMPIGSLKRDLLNSKLDLEDDDDILTLSRRYSVSSQAMSYRIANLFLPKFE